MPKGKEQKDKEYKALTGRVKKVIKKSRRKLGEEKFERELQRTITFLTELQARLSAPPPAKPKNAGNGKAAGKQAAPLASAKPGAANKNL